MKKNYIILLFKFIFIYSFGFTSIKAQTNLSDGDIVFTRIDISSDQFSFVFLTKVEAGTEFFITDEKWKNTNFGNNESTLKVSVNSTINAGEECHINPNTSPIDISFTSGATSLITLQSVGTYLPYPNRNMLGSAGDQLFIYQNSSGIKVISGINANEGNIGSSDNAWNTSITSISNSPLPTGKSNANNGFLGLFQNGINPKVYNARYKESALHTGDKGTILTSIMNYQNWDFSNTVSFTPSTSPFNVIPNKYTWTGTNNNNWNTAANWDTNSIPISSSDVTIPNGLTNYPTISSAVAVNSISIASGASLIANASVTGTTTYTRNLPTTNWYLVSAPVSGETQQDIIANHTFASGSGSNIGIGAYTNNGTTPWVYATAATTGPLVSGVGVSMKLAAAGDVSITGSVNTSNVSFPVSTGTRNNFNLIGNPFTSYVSSSDFATANTGLLSEETVWLWNGSQYVTYNNMTPIQIAPAQGFFVEASGSGNVTFSTANQSHQGTDTFHRGATIPSLELFIQNNSDNKQSTKVFYVDGKTKGFDNGYDSKMFNGATQNFTVFTHLISNNDGRNLAIQTLPNSDLETMVIPVGVIAEANKEITFSINSQNLPSGIKVYLEDRINNKFIDLSENTYLITLANNSNGTGQFYIHTTSQKLSTGDFRNNLDNVSIYKSASKEITISGLQTNANITVYSILGKELIKTQIVSNGSSQINLPYLAPGVYIVRLSSDLGNMTKKIILE
ncbi:hypothetical protein WH52_07050 [Tenacibaculum holothuriorum]|uniref:Secretion system C-terminal sorting domain-containing protein n=1 Tax=Tenacibaculum holothuriorum TaxID=1635173 RepID=A0A1Y2PDF9_9FLAO|nr:T9SS type A sorting domain-containing protein [Tenacibaculum holothuriorum]OSY88502.1 hypothetical protein WH52_07050 [Tenacibaculum holothuriorum]